MKALSPLDELRRQMANTLADVKAYDLPGVCKRYGLRVGTEQEAFSSKFRYVHQRLVELPKEDLVNLARAVLADFQDAELDEALARVVELAERRVSDLTRRKVITYLDEVILEGRLGIIEFLEPIFPLDQITSMYDNADPFVERTARQDVERHCVANDDLTNSELLKHLGVFTCSQKRFFAFLERLLERHPLRLHHMQRRRNSWRIRLG